MMRNHYTHKLCPGGVGWIAIFRIWFLSITYNPSVGTATAKYHRLGVSNKRHLFLIVLKAEKSKIQVLEDLVLWLSDGCFLSVPSHGRGNELWSLILVL